MKASGGWSSILLSGHWSFIVSHLRGNWHSRSVHIWFIDYLIVYYHWINKFIYILKVIDNFFYLSFLGIKYQCLIIFPLFIYGNTDLECFSRFKLNTVSFKSISKNEMQKFINNWVKANINLEPTKKSSVKVYMICSLLSQKQKETQRRKKKKWLVLR